LHIDSGGKKNPYSYVVYTLEIKEMLDGAVVRPDNEWPTCRIKLLSPSSLSLIVPEDGGQSECFSETW